MAGKAGRSEGIRGSVIEVAGSARTPNRSAAEGDSKRGEVKHAQEQGGQIAGDGAFARKERGNREDSGRRDADACPGGCSEESVGLKRGGNL